MAHESRYDAVADLYVGEVGDRLGDEGTAALLDLVGDVAGRRILDVACGQGRVSRELARHGAMVTAVDLSTELIDRARAAHQPGLGTPDYRVTDICDPDVLAGNAFDGAVCNFGISDIDDLDGMLRSVRRLLGPGGFFVLSLLHPCFPGWPGRASSAWPPGSGYFREGWWRTPVRSSRIRHEVGANHRTLSTYLTALINHGFALEFVREPHPPAEWLTADPTVDPVPAFLVLRCRAVDH